VVIPAVLVVTGLVALVACTTGAADRTARTLPPDCRAPVLYVALGDSTVEGIGATSPPRNYVNRILDRLRSVYPAARVENLGVGGAVSGDVLAHQVERALELRPDLVTLSVGPNDITTGVPVAEYERNVDRILKRLTRGTKAVIVVNLLPDLAVTPRFVVSDRREAVGRLAATFNRSLAGKAREYGVDTVDLYERSRAEVPRRPELVAEDGYHPSDLGYERWAELMWSRVEPRTPRC
jgi:lysophospholipase L1-like esterase